MPTAVELPITIINVESEKQQEEGGHASNLLAPSSKPVIGIIYPPPEVRNIVDKTASFVARNGPEFESRIRQNEINNPKFNFLNQGDPYHAYYQNKVKEFREGKAYEPVPVQAPTERSLTVQQQKQQDIFKEALIIPKEPPPKYEFVADPPSISAYDLDVVKLTAQFVARNGKQFLTNLMNREQRNYQFDFLRPQHSLFQYFTRLLEQYMMILIPDKQLLVRLRNESYNQKAILEQVRYRVEWQKLQDAQRRREEEEAERERVAYAQIDWHDFVIVETVDYQLHEIGHFPPPCQPEDVGARMLMEQRLDVASVVPIPQPQSESESGEEEEEEEEEEEPANQPSESANTQVQDMEEESSEGEQGEEEVRLPRITVREGMAITPNAAAQPPLPPVPEQVIVKKDYDPKVKTTPRHPTSDEYLISPLTGEKIPASKIQEHMRIGLLDPRWVEQRDRQITEKIHQESVYAAGSAIVSSLKQLEERRTDIFGTGAEETVIGKKIGEEEERKRDDRVIWDGHTASVEAATRAAQAHISLEEQIAQIHRSKGLLPDEEKEKIGPQLSSPSTGIITSISMSQTPSSVSIATTSGVTKKTEASPKTTSKQLIMQSAPKVIQGLPQPAMFSTAVVAAAPPMLGGVPVMSPQGMVMMSPMGPPPMMGYGTPMGYVTMISGDLLEDGEPLSKRPRNEENLIPECEFLATFKGPVTFQVQIPANNEKSEWNLNGQVLTLTLALSDTISVLKARIHEETGVPPGKQKLQWEGLFFKDSNTLAYYNIIPNALVLLSLKERGGRKK